MSKKVSCTVLLAAFSLIIGGVVGVDGYEIVAVGGSTPTIDGTVDTSEWSDAVSVQLNHTFVLVKQDGNNLYVGFRMAYPMVSEPNATIIFDVDHDGAKLLQPDDLKIWIFRNGTLGEANVVDWQWSPTTVRGWNAEIRTYEFSWDAEFNITYSKVDVVSGMEKTMGAGFLATSFHYGEYKTDSWPSNISMIVTNPSALGNLTSTGYDWIPELPAIIILPALMLATSIATLAYKKKSMSDQLNS